MQRTFLTTRSVEFDALLVAAAPPSASAATPGSVVTSGQPPAEGAPIDPRVSLLLSEAFRHAKVIGAWGPGRQALAAAGAPTGSPGVVVSDDPKEVLEQVMDLLAEHRVWDRFSTVGGPA